MAILKRNRFLNPDQILSSTDREVIVENGRLAGRTDLFPKINLFEETENWVFTFEVPGVHPNDLKLTLQNTMLTVSGRRSSFYEGGESKIHCQESCIGECDFKRSVYLPGDADPQSTHAHLKYGMLFVTLDKKENSREIAFDIQIDDRD